MNRFTASLHRRQGVETISSYYTSLLQAANSICKMKTTNNNIYSSASKKESKVVAKEKHRKAEMNRRSRMNSQYNSLRAVLPNLIKKDKASVLGETLRCVKELKREVSELKSKWGGSYKLEGEIPSEEDKLRVEENSEGQEKIVKVMFSCDEKKKLMSDVARAVKSVKGKVVKAEMVAIGGRTKLAIWVSGVKCNEELCMLRKAIRDVTEKSKYARGSKRQSTSQAHSIFTF